MGSLHHITVDISLKLEALGYISVTESLGISYLQLLYAVRAESYRIRWNNEK